MSGPADDTTGPDAGGRGGVRRERSLSRRIIILLLIASVLMIGQSLHNLFNLKQVDISIGTMRDSADNLDELARGIATPIADIRMLSMKSVLAPNQALVEETTERLEQRIRELEARLTEIQTRLDQGGGSQAGYSEFAAIRSAWERYREAQAKTRYYINQGIRVAAFISVTEQEGAYYETLKESLAAFGATQIARSQDVHGTAEDNSRWPSTPWS
jgi:hypothetical protein